MTDVVDQPSVSVECKDKIATVTIHNPSRRNAMTLGMWNAMGDIFLGLNKDKSVQAVILTGSNGHFSAGADISEFGALRSSPAQAEIYANAGHRAQEAIFNVSKPVVAAISGSCVGGGFGLAICCDFRIAEANARMGITAARIGLVYGVRETQCLLATAGLAKAKRILFGGQLYSATEMGSMGVVDEVAESNAIEAAKRWAVSLAENAPLSMAGSKLILNGLASGVGGLDVTSAENAARIAIASEDYRTAVAAFANKELPVFNGE